MNKGILSILIFVFACGQFGSGRTTEIADEFLDLEIQRLKERLDERIYSTGYTEVGKSFKQQTNELLKLSELILGLNDIEELKSKSLDLSTFSKSMVDSVSTDFLLASIESLNRSQIEEFRRNVKIYLIRLLRVYEEKYNSLFLMFDMLRPVVIPRSMELKRGMDFVAEVSMEAAMSGIEPEILIKPENQNQYFPLEISNRNQRAQLTITKPAPGKHQFDLKIRIFNNLEEHEMDLTYEFEVK